MNEIERLYKEQEYIRAERELAQEALANRLDKIQKTLPEYAALQKAKEAWEVADKSIYIEPLPEFWEWLKSGVMSNRPMLPKGDLLELADSEQPTVKLDMIIDGWVRIEINYNNMYGLSGMAGPVELWKVANHD